MIHINGLFKSYGSNFTLSVSDLTLKVGTTTALLGPNGSGKTTLLKLLAGVEPADAGSICFGGMELKTGEGVPLQWRRAVTMVMQEPYLFRGTVAFNVAYGLKLRGFRADAYRETVRDALKQVDLENFEHRKASELSGGEIKRIALARALALKLNILLLDEPTANVDTDNINRVEELIRSLNNKAGYTVIIATHNLEQAYRLSDTVISIIGGKIVPAHPENVFAGEVRETRNGLKAIALRGGLEIETNTPLSGRVHLTINPTDIIVSSEKFVSSARNSFLGKLVSINVHGNRVRLSVEAGIIFSAVVTKKSYRELGLHPGDRVYLTFKSTAVKVF